MLQLKKAGCFLSWLLLFRCVFSQEKKRSPIQKLADKQKACFPNSLKCILLMNERKAFGCSQCDSSTVTGPLRIIDTQDTAGQIRNGDFENDIVMAPESFALSSGGLLESMNKRDKVARAIIVAEHVKWWDENRNSKEKFPDIALPSYSADKTVPNEDYLFPINASNPLNLRGLAFMYGRWRVNMFYISSGDADIIRNVHKDIQKRADAGEGGIIKTAPIFIVESSGKMTACTTPTVQSPQPSPGAIVGSEGENLNSKECLREGTCLPVGGYSVWSSMSPINETTFNTSKPREIVAVTAPMDSAALFHDMAYGAAAEIASIAVLMAVVKSVGDYGRKAVIPIQRHPMYFAFNAQSWGFSGSGRFLEDVKSFKCKEGNNTDGFCEHPIAPSMKFKQLENATFSVINLGGLINKKVKLKEGTEPEPDFFIHGFEDGNKNGTGGEVERKLRRQFRRTNLNISGGFRNGSFMDASQSFQKYAPNADVVTLTNFRQNFTNVYYHSLWDNATLFSDVRDPLYQAAKAVANTVIELSFNDSNANVALESDLINDVIECLTTNWAQKNCSLAQEYMGDDYLPIYQRVFSSNYAGVFVPPDFALEKNPNGHAKSLFIQRFMAYHTRLGPQGAIKDNDAESIFTNSKCSNVTECQRVDGATQWEPRNFKPSFCAKGTCVSAESHLHAAFGTGLKDTNQARTEFEVREPESPLASPSPAVSMRTEPVQPAWTESTWGRDLGLCYRIEDTPLFGGAVLGSGLATFVLCLIMAFFLNPSRAFFKGDSDAVHGQPVLDVQP